MSGEIRVISDFFHVAAIQLAAPVIHLVLSAAQQYEIMVFADRIMQVLQLIFRYTLTVQRQCNLRECGGARRDATTESRPRGGLASRW